MSDPRFHAFAYCTLGTREELAQGMVGKDGRFYQRMLDNLSEYVRICDQAGFAGFGHPEHHLQIEGMENTGSPGLISMFIGQHSERLKVDVFGWVVNTHNPLRVAEDVAILDHLLKGRLNVAFVRGYQHRWFSNLAAVPGGVDAVGYWNKGEEADARNRRAFEEAVAIIKRAWAEDTFSYAGEFWNFPAPDDMNPHRQDAYVRYGRGVDDDMAIREVGIAPRPYQAPHPPLYAGFTHSMTSVRYWAREGGKPICLVLNDDLYATMTREYREHAAQHGRTVAPGSEIALGGQLVITRDQAETDRILAEAKWFWDTWGVPFGLGMPEMLVGDADFVSRRIEHALETLGTDELFFLLGDGLFGHDVVTRSLETFASEVMPRFCTASA